jgi:uncharacterized protein (DUF486 family)
LIQRPGCADNTGMMRAAPTVVLLLISNVFMTFAWYYHLKNPYLSKAPLFVTIVVSWLIAFFEYCFQVPGNRFGYRAHLSGSQLKIIQEAITLLVFIVFARVQLEERLTWNYLVGFALVFLGVFVVFYFRTDAGLVR